MTGRFIISLDFELMWGVRDHRSVADYGDAVLGGRKAIPLVLDLFEEFGVCATWATVGLLFAETRSEMLHFAPKIRPRYKTPSLSPYPALETVGADEKSDPYHFGRNLLDRIAQTKGQEIATHTFGHIYALEPGMTLDAWRADLVAALQIAENAGYPLRSIVFPRNQMTAENMAICGELGISVIRGNPRGAIYRPRSGDDLGLPVRALRYLDDAVPLFGAQSIHEPSRQAGVVDVPASRFLRPWNARVPLYSALHQQRIRQEMTQAAKSGRGYHLWWHPHNMGRNITQNMSQLRGILDHFALLQGRYDFQSATMADYGGAA